MLDCGKMIACMTSLATLQPHELSVSVIFHVKFSFASLFVSSPLTMCSMQLKLLISNQPASSVSDGVMATGCRTQPLPLSLLY